MTDDERKELNTRGQLLELCTAFAAEPHDEKGQTLRNQIAELMPKTYVESLKQLADKGPVHDGDVMSKATRGVLIQLKLAHRVLVKGEWGYTACTYLGGHVLNAVEELLRGKDEN